MLQVVAMLRELMPGSANGSSNSGWKLEHCVLFVDHIV
jgi:hypothetical protein